MTAPPNDKAARAQGKVRLPKWDSNNPLLLAANKQKPRIRRWAERQSRQSLEAQFVEVTAALLLERSLTRAREALYQDALRQGWAKANKNRPKDDPKKAAKLGALELWKQRQAGKRPDLGTVEQFATEVMRLWPVLKSAQNICRWSADWGKQVRAGENPSC